MKVKIEGKNCYVSLYHEVKNGWPSPTIFSIIHVSCFRLQWSVREQDRVVALDSSDPWLSYIHYFSILTIDPFKYFYWAILNCKDLSERMGRNGFHRLYLILTNLAGIIFRDFCNFKKFVKFNTHEQNIVWNLNMQNLIPYFQKQNNRSFKNVLSLGVFLNCAHLLNISGCILSSELYDIHCIDCIHSKQLCFVLFIRFFV